MNRCPHPPLLFRGILAAMAFLAGHAGTAETPPDIRRIREKGFLTVSMHHRDVPPFFVTGKDGAVSGFDADLAKNIARRLRVDIRFDREADTFDAVIDRVADRRADLGVSMLSNTLGRAQRVAFSRTYVTLHQTLVINRTRFARLGRKTNLMKWIDRRETTLGVLEGSSYIEYARDTFPNVSLLLFGDYAGLFESVLRGDTVALLADSVEVNNFYSANPESGLYLKTRVLKNKPDPLAIAVHWEDRHLLLWLDYFLERIGKDGTLEALKHRHLGAGAPEQSGL